MKLISTRYMKNRKLWSLGKGKNVLIEKQTCEGSEIYLFQSSKTLKTTRKQTCHIAAKILQNKLHKGSVMLVSVKSATRSNTLENKCKTKYLKFVLRSFV